MCGLAGLILVLAWLVRYSTRSTLDGFRSSGYAKLAFVFMGISFLLLETKSVIQFSLLFGTTWVNTSLVFLAVLISVLLANWTARLFPRPKIATIAYLCLILFCISSVLFPLSNLLAVSNRFFRFVLASVLTFSPIFFANLIFGLAFHDRKHAEELFGWNLIGAALGGIIEYTSKAIGYNALALLVALCYTLAFLFLKREQARHMQYAGA